jgi:hypothetical protein
LSEHSEGKPPTVADLQKQPIFNGNRIFCWWPAGRKYFCRSDYIDGVARNRERSLVLLREAVRVLNEDLADQEQQAQPTHPATPSAEKPAELFTLKPGIWGMNFDLKEAWRRANQWWRGRK